MIKKIVEGKTAVFIDASNIYFSQKELKWEIDFLRLKKYFEKNSELLRIYFYTAYDPEHIKQRKFLDFLEIIGYTVRKKKVKFIKGVTKEDSFHKGNLDVELTIDAMDKKDDFQSLVLLSGDSDFEALIKYMKAHKKRCVVVSTKNHIAIELMKQAKYLNIKKLRKFIEKRP